MSPLKNENLQKYGRHDKTTRLKKICLEHAWILLASPISRECRREISWWGVRKGGLTCTRHFLHFTGLTSSHKSGTGDHKTVVFAPREYISPPSSRSASPGVLNVRAGKQAECPAPPFPFATPPLPSLLLPQLLHLKRTMEYVRHCDISERRLQKHWRVSYGGCSSPRDTWCLS